MYSIYLDQIYMYTCVAVEALTKSINGFELLVRHGYGYYIYITYMFRY